MSGGYFSFRTHCQYGWDDSRICTLLFHEVEGAMIIGSPSEGSSRSWFIKFTSTNIAYLLDSLFHQIAMAFRNSQ